MANKNPRVQASVLNFVKIKRYLIPADKLSYQILYKLGIPAVRFDEDFIETLQLLTKKKRLRGRAIPFSSILNEFTEQLCSRWETKPYRKATILPTSWKFEAKDLENARKLYPKLEERVRKFFRAWGFSVNSEFYESPTRSRLVITFKYDKDRLPLIEFRGLISTSYS